MLYFSCYSVDAFLLHSLFDAFFLCWNAWSQFFFWKKYICFCFSSSFVVLSRQPTKRDALRKKDLSGMRGDDGTCLLLGSLLFWDDTHRFGRKKHSSATWLNSSFAGIITTWLLYGTIVVQGVPHPWLPIMNKNLWKWTGVIKKDLIEKGWR